MSRLKTGGYAPLFDRLEQPRKDEEERITWLDIKLLERSVFREITRISQTRSRLHFDEYLKKNRLTVLDYGLPDFYGYSIQNSDERNKIRLVLEKGLYFFEPRFKNVKILHISDNSNKSNLEFHISGDLQTQISLEPVTFLISSEEKIEEVPVGGDILVN